MNTKNVKQQQQQNEYQIYKYNTFRFAGKKMINFPMKICRMLKLYIQTNACIMYICCFKWYHEKITTWIRREFVLYAFWKRTVLNCGNILLSNDFECPHFVDEYLLRSPFELPKIIFHPLRLLRFDMSEHVTIQTWF